LNFRAFLEYNPLHIPMPVGGNTVGVHNDGNRDGSIGSFLPTTWTGSEDLGVMGYGLPSVDLSTPSVSRRCRVRDVLNGPTYVYHDKRRRNDPSNKSPVKIIFDDGTFIEMPLPRFEDLWNSGTKICPSQNGKPGLLVQVTFQRNPMDRSPTASRVNSIKLL